MPPLSLPPPPRPERLLVIVAHPADADEALGGSVAIWVASGTTAQLVCCTSGDATGDDATADPLELASRREQGQRDAAMRLGYEEVTFLHAPDGAVANDLALREQLVRRIRAFGPDTVATCDPRALVHAGGRVNQADHRATGLAAVEALPPAGNAMAFPSLVRHEGLAPHHVRRLLLFWAEHPTHALDVSAQLDLKARALGAHPGRHDPETTALAATEDFVLLDLA